MRREKEPDYFTRKKGRGKKNDQILPETIRKKEVSGLFSRRDFIIVFQGKRGGSPFLLVYEEKIGESHSARSKDLKRIRVGRE